MEDNKYEESSNQEGYGSNHHEHRIVHDEPARRHNKKINRSIVALFAVLILASNAATFFLVRGAQENAAQEEPATIIRYEPAATNRGREPELSIFFEALDSLRENYYYPVDTDLLVEGAVRGMIQELEDPQVRFYDPDDLENFLIDTRGSYGGIGVRIIEVNRHIVVFETFADSPAERVGLSPGDRIVKADGHDLTGEGLGRAVELLRGPDNTAVEVRIERPGADEPLEMVVDREEIRVATVFGDMIESGIGYIRIANFDGNTAEEFTAKFRAMEQSGLGRGLILDLRNNPGGLVDQAVEVAKLLVPEGEIVRLVGRDGEVKTIFYSSAAAKPYPIIVLINEESASSSELLAGALQDSGAAKLVGKTTFGKASVQQMERLSGGSAIILTVAKYFTASGHDIDEYGIEPDHEVEMPEILRYYRYFHPGSLDRGDYGPEVEMLQYMLEQIGYTLEVTGFFDDQTAEVLGDFQAYNSLPRTGVFDDRTWVELRNALDVASREQDEQLNFALELVLGFAGVDGSEEARSHGGND